MKTAEIVALIASYIGDFDDYWKTQRACEGDGSESKLIEAIRALLFEGKKVDGPLKFD